MLNTRQGAVPAVKAAVIASSEDEAAGSTCELTCSSGCSSFQESTTAFPQASSCSLFESQTLISPVPAPASWPSPPPPPAEQPVTRSTAAPMNAAERILLMVSSSKRQGPRSQVLRC